MDRDRLRAWLSSPRHTWRWRRDAEQVGYEAVEASPDGLRWYRWSHYVEDGGEQDVAHQSFADFRAQGPPRWIPQATLDELRRWIARHGS